MPDNHITFLPLNHPDATDVIRLLRRAREDQEYTNAIISAAVHMVALNALDAGITCPEKATEHFTSLVGKSILANRNTAGSA